MKSFRSSFLRPWGTILYGVSVLGLILAAWYGFLWVVIRTPGRDWRPIPWTSLFLEPAFISPAALIAIIGAWIVLYQSGSSRGRYRAGATELEVRSGWVWRRTQYLRYVDIKNIELRDGPLMRLVGTSDVEIWASEAPHRVLLHGIPDGEGFRRFLLDRRVSLKELESERT
ncbi:MAG TPA: PH domain-containing protein [Planctomycetota bacterium]|nr:PH domain-containing protein [Planctomycetota bacterium]